MAPRRGIVALLIVVTLLAGCGSGSGTAGGTTASSTKLTSITIGMGYFANVQFAPFYVALAKGYYRQAGLNVHFNYGIEPNLLRLASVGKFDFVVSGGDEVLAAAAQGLHVRYVMTQYSRFPTAVFSLRSAGIHGPQGLRGRTVGVPGTYGASYVGLLALLKETGVPRSALTIKTIGFTQVASVAHHKVDAAVGYAMNEPIDLRAQGVAVNEIDVDRYADIAGVGIAAGSDVIAHRPGIVRAFVRATLRGMRDTLSNPNRAFRISENAVKEIKAQPAIQRRVLMRCLDFWRPEKGHPLGWVNPRVWSSTERYLYTFKQIPRQVPATQAYTNRFVPGS